MLHLDLNQQPYVKESYLDFRFLHNNQDRSQIESGLLIELGSMLLMGLLLGLQ